MRKIILLGMAGAVLLFLNGCMMWMHGGMMEHGEHKESALSGTILVKELQSGNVKITVEVPPLVEHKEALLTMQIEDTKADTSVTGATADVSIQKTGGLGNTGSQHKGHEEHGLIERKAQEGADKGIYALRYAFPEHGLYEMTFKVTGVQGVEAPLTLTVRKEVQPMHKAEDMRHDGIDTKTATIAVIGGAAMVVMMLLVML